MPPFSRPLPIFPLPNCVVLPRASQGLHIFEPRYRSMVQDELSRDERDRFIAMAFLREGYESQYCTHQAPIHPTVCIGAVTQAELLPDGRYNIVLCGRHRATIDKELHDRAYRRGHVVIVETQTIEPTQEKSHRTALAEALQHLPESLSHIACDILKHESELEHITDLLTYYILQPESAPAKQMILAETRLDYRIKMLITLIERQCARRSDASPGIAWPPPPCSDN